MEWSNKDLYRFWKKINKNSNHFGIDGKYPTECWEWMASTVKGYGRIGFNKKLYLAHRVSWIIHYGSIPDEKCVLHKCDNRLCMNPTHLFIGTRIDNNKDRCKKGRSSGGRNGGGHIGEKNGRSKLTLEDVISIKKLLKNNESGAEIARQYKVKKETIYAIKHERNWSHA